MVCGVPRGIMVSARLWWQTGRMAIRIWPGHALMAGVVGIALAACTVRHEQEPGNSVKHVEPMRVSTEDAGQASVYLSVLLRIEGDAVSVEKIDRVQGKLRHRRGVRQRRGLLVIAKDASGRAVHHEVILDPRLVTPEYVSDSGALRRANATPETQYALVRVPITSSRLFVHEAHQGAADGTPIRADTEQPPEPPATTEYPLIATLDLGVH
jgi:hypothetical protein